MSGIITGGYGSNQSIILEGFGTGYLMRFIYETVLMEERIYKKVSQVSQSNMNLLDEVTRFYPRLTEFLSEGLHYLDDHSFRGMKSLLESTMLHESYSRIYIAYRTFIQSMTMEEGFSKRLMTSLGEMLNLSDMASRWIASHLEEMLNFLGNTSKWMVNSLGEILSFSDSFQNVLGRVLITLPQVIRRFIPYRYVPFEKRFVLEGSLKVPIEIEKELTGSPFIRESKGIIITGDLKTPILGKVQIQGNPMFSVRYITRIQGNLLRKIETPMKVTGGILSKIMRSLPIRGSLKTKIEKLIKIKGKKDFNKVIWEILEEENGNNGE